MKFLVCCGPFIKFIFDKYRASLPPRLSLSPPAQKFARGEAVEPPNLGQLIEVLSAIQAQLVAESVPYRVATFRKYIGVGGVVRGLLNVLADLGHETHVFAFTPAFRDTIRRIFSRLSPLDDVRFIAPLNLDENDEIYDYLFKNYQVPVFPLTSSVFLSKWVKNITFAPHSPRAFYIPEGASASDYMGQIQALSREQGIEYLFLKDEFDFNSGAAVPYFIAPVGKLPEFCAKFYERAKGVDNLGGLLMEEFLAEQNTLDVYKVHVLGRVIPGEYLHYRVELAEYTGGAAYDDVITRIGEEAADIPNSVAQLLDASIRTYYPFIFSSVDYILDGSSPKVIDLNSIAGSLGRVQELRKSDSRNPFLFFVEQIGKPAENTCEVQQNYRRKIATFHENARNVGPSFFSGTQIISLSDNFVSKLPVLK